MYDINKKTIQKSIAVIMKIFYKDNRKRKLQRIHFVTAMIWICCFFLYRFVASIQKKIQQNKKQTVKSDLFISWRSSSRFFVWIFSFFCRFFLHVIQTAYSLNNDQDLCLADSNDGGHTNFFAACQYKRFSVQQLFICCEYRRF